MVGDQRWRALNGINLGQQWPNIGFISSGQFTNLGGANITNFLVTNAIDHHIYDWWVSPQNQLTGFDLTARTGVPWVNVNIVTTGQFTANGGTNLLVSNNIDHHLYDWWITSNNTLGGIDLGPYWGNVSIVANGQFTTNGGTNFLVSNNIDHHLYDWWIGSNNTLQGIDLGAYWSNVQLVAVGRFDNNTTNTQMLVQNTADHHLYEWWITAQGGGAAGAAAGGVGADAVNSAGLLDAPTPAVPASSDPTALMAQAMASFGTGGALNSAPLLTSDPAPQSAFGAAADPRSAHA